MIATRVSKPFLPAKVFNANLPGAMEIIIRFDRDQLTQILNAFHCWVDRVTPHEIAALTRKVKESTESMRDAIEDNRP